MKHRALVFIFLALPFHFGTIFAQTSSASSSTIVGSSSSPTTTPSASISQTLVAPAISATTAVVSYSSTRTSSFNMTTSTAVTAPVPPPTTPNTVPPSTSSSNPFLTFLRTISFLSTLSDTSLYIISAIVVVIVVGICYAIYWTLERMGKKELYNMYKTEHKRRKQAEARAKKNANRKSRDGRSGDGGNVKSRTKGNSNPDRPYKTREFETEKDSNYTEAQSYNRESQNSLEMISQEIEIPISNREPPMPIRPSVQPTIQNAQREDIFEGRKVAYTAADSEASSNAYSRNSTGDLHENVPKEQDRERKYKSLRPEHLSKNTHTNDKMMSPRTGSSPIKATLYEEAGDSGPSRRGNFGTIIEQAAAPQQPSSKNSNAPYHPGQRQSKENPVKIPVSNNFSTIIEDADVPEEAMEGVTRSWMPRFSVASQSSQSHTKKSANNDTIIEDSVSGIREVVESPTILENITTSWSPRFSISASTPVQPLPPLRIPIAQNGGDTIVEYGFDDISSPKSPLPADDPDIYLNATRSWKPAFSAPTSASVDAPANPFKGNSPFNPVPRNDYRDSHDRTIVELGDDEDFMKPRRFSNRLSNSGEHDVDVIVQNPLKGAAIISPMGISPIAKAMRPTSSTMDDIIGDIVGKIAAASQPGSHRGSISQPQSPNKPLVNLSFIREDAEMMRSEAESARSEKVFMQQRSPEFDNEATIQEIVGYASVKTDDSKNDPQSNTTVQEVVYAESAHVHVDDLEINTAKKSAHNFNHDVKSGEERNIVEQRVFSAIDVEGPLGQVNLSLTPEATQLEQPDQAKKCSSSASTQNEGVLVEFISVESIPIQLKHRTEDNQVISGTTENLVQSILTRKEEVAAEETLSNILAADLAEKTTPMPMARRRISSVDPEHKRTEYETQIVFEDIRVNYQTDRAQNLDIEAIPQKVLLRSENESEYSEEPYTHDDAYGNQRHLQAQQVHKVGGETIYADFESHSEAVAPKSSLQEDSNDSTLQEASIIHNQDALKVSESNRKVESDQSLAERVRENILKEEYGKAQNSNDDESIKTSIELSSQDISPNFQITSLPRNIGSGKSKAQSIMERLHKYRSKERATRASISNPLRNDEKQEDIEMMRTPRRRLVSEAAFDEEVRKSRNFTEIVEYFRAIESTSRRDLRDMDDSTHGKEEDRENVMDRGLLDRENSREVESALLQQDSKLSP